MAIVNEKDSVKAPLIISSENPGTNPNANAITLLPTNYPNNYLLNSLDIGVTGKLGYTSDKIITASNELVPKKYVDDADTLKLNLSGGTMSGALDMDTYKVTSSYVPTHIHDLTNK
jgi:hypothetical protein